MHQACTVEGLLLYVDGRDFVRAFQVRDPALITMLY